MTSSNTKEDRFFKEPNKIVQNMGKLTVNMKLKCPKDFPATCVAMESIAKAENRDDIAKRNGNDDYSIALEKLFNAFDTFIREYNKGKKGKRGAGWIKNYDITDPYELTIFLLWQIRHTWTHHGGLIDEKCKIEYETSFKSALKKGIKPIIDLPEKLEIGNEFTIKFEDYNSIRKSIFKYIGKRITKKDLEILSKRASFTNIKFNELIATINYEFGTLIFDLVEAYDCGCEIDPVTKEFKTPSELEYNFVTERVVLISTGKSFPAKLVKHPE